MINFTMYNVNWKLFRFMHAGTGGPCCSSLFLFKFWVYFVWWAWGANFNVIFRHLFDSQSVLASILFLCVLSFRGFPLVKIYGIVAWKKNFKTCSSWIVQQFGFGLTLTRLKQRAALYTRSSFWNLDALIIKLAIDIG